jgi:anthranilate/para-aminobenzoate synthase component I
MLARLARERGLALLDSAAGDPCRWSIVAFDPRTEHALPSDIRALSACARSFMRAGGDEPPGPFAGGFIGALSYELGVQGERPARCAPDPWRSPRSVGGFYTDFIVRDELRGEAWLVLDEGRPRSAGGIERRRAEIEAALSADGAPAPGAAPAFRSGPLVRHTPAARHRARIARARELIAAGEFYQANLAHRFTRRVEADPVDIYRRLRALNPAPYMAYLAWDPRLATGGAEFARGALLSASPELLFEFDGEIARTRPIKGTARRGADAAEDERLARALLSSPKDLAELAMIVDLERNDLGRIAEPGSVQVERFPALASYASVHHLSADVVARPRAGIDAADILCALFPGGSVTGAPKLASMDAIAALEGEGRGFFTGALGFIDARGRAAFNILIRTLVWRPRAGPRLEAGGAEPGEISFHVGSGITWASNADDEEAETLDKATPLAAATASSAETGARTRSTRRHLRESPT